VTIIHKNRRFWDIYFNEYTVHLTEMFCCFKSVWKSFNRFLPIYREV